MGESLVLNATYEPLCVVSARRAVVLCLSGRAVPVALSGGVLRSASAAVQVPAVVRLTRFVRVPHRPVLPLTRKAVFARDGGRCGYCGAAATSLDHVVPRSRGGGHTWDNVVSACGRCNHAKADRSLADMGWRLSRPPAAPTGAAWRVVGARRVEPSWQPYLTGWGAGWAADRDGDGDRDRDRDADRGALKGAAWAPDRAANQGAPWPGRGAARGADWGATAQRWGEPA